MTCWLWATAAAKVASKVVQSGVGCPAFMTMLWANHARNTFPADPIADSSALSSTGPQHDCKELALALKMLNPVNRNGAPFSINCRPDTVTKLGPAACAPITGVDTRTPISGVDTSTATTSRLIARLFITYHLYEPRTGDRPTSNG